MPQYILLRGAKQLLTLRGPSGVRRGADLHDLGIIEDGSVLIRDGTIAAVGSTRRLENLKEARTALEIPVHGRIVTPGFVDASLSLKLQREPEARRPKTAHDFYEETLGLMRSCLHHGTLAVDVKASSGDERFRADIPVLRKLAAIGSNPVRMVRTWRIDRSWQVDNGRVGDFDAAFDVLTRRKLIDSLEFAATADADLSEPVLAAVEQVQIAKKLFWAGGQADVLADLLKRLRPHAVCRPSGLQPDEAELLGQTPAVVVLGIGKEMFEGAAAQSARQFVESGGALALSSGYDSRSATTFSMQMAIALAVVRLGLTAEEAFTAATINAAHAAGCGHLTGSLEFGKQADVLILGVNDYREIPRQFGINHVDMVVRQGNIVFNRTRWKAAAP